MKNQIKKLAIAATLLLQASLSRAGLDWSHGTLSNPDNLKRNTSSIAYSASGSVFVTGVEENITGNKLIVTKKYSSTGSLQNSATNAYAIIAGTIVSDLPVSVKVDGADNVYVLGRQYATTSRGNDVVLIKYNSQLVQQWKKLIYNTNQPNNFDDRPCKIVFDASNNVYVTGTWNNVTITGFTEEIFVRKYSTTGTLFYSTTVPQSVGKTIDDVTDMCIDNSLNVTVCAWAKDANNVYSILYARITNTGSLSWKKFYSPNTVYTQLFNPEIECTSVGTLYLATIAWRRPNNYDSYVKLATAKLNSSGALQWENITAELNEYADAIALRLDALNNIYVGADYLNSPTPTYKNHRIYKMNSSGTTLWVYVSPETSKYFTFETFSSTSLFVLFEKSSPVNPVLRKIDAATGATTWTEDMPFGGVPGYYHSQLQSIAIAVNNTTSEVAFCGYLIASIYSPNYAEEYRWHIRKYGATSPRVSSNEDQVTSESNLSLFPNPVNDVMYIHNSNAEEVSSVSIVDVSGKEIYNSKIAVPQPPVKHSLIKLQTSHFPNGMYFVKVVSISGIETRKIIVKH